MRDLCVTNQKQAHWVEHIHKEAVVRATWNLHYGHKYLKEVRARQQSRRAPFRTVLSADPMFATGLPISKRVQIRQPETQGDQESSFRPKSVDSTPSNEARARQAKEPAVQSRPEGLVMRKAPEDTLKLLYQGISHDGQGRALYLRERYQQPPRDKFPYPLLSSWEYGWHMGDVAKNYRTPIFAKVQPVSKTFYTKNSIFHFPRRTDQLM